MKNVVTRFLGALLALTMCLSMLACGLAEEATPNPNDVMALVNGTAITRADLEGYLSEIQYELSMYGYDVTGADLLPELYDYSINLAVEYALIDQKIVDLGIELTDEERAQQVEEATAQWQEIVESYMAQYYGVTSASTEEEIANARTGVLALLDSMGYTESSWLDQAVEYALYEKFAAELVKDVQVTDEQVQAAFDARVAEHQMYFENDIAYYEYMTQYYGEPSYYTPAGYRGVTHILLEVDQELLDNWQALSARLEEQQDEEESTDVEEEPAEDTDPEAVTAEPEPTPEPVTQEQVDAAYAAVIASVQETIDEIYAKLEAGVPFADLVAEYGTDPGMTVEPNKSEGYPVHMDSIIWDPAFVAGAFSVDEVGAVADPVVGSYGVHIIQYTRDIPAGPVELTNELRTSIADEVLAEAESSYFEEQLAGWKEAAEIVYSEELQALLPAAAEVETPAE